MRLISVLVVTTLLFSCNKPNCANTNPVFDKYPPQANEYKAELIKQLNSTDRKKISYWIDGDTVINGAAYMRMFLQGGGLCARGVFDITNAKGLNNFKKVKGVGYSGGELKGFKYTIDSAGGNYRFVFEEVAWIAD